MIVVPGEIIHKEDPVPFNEQPEDWPPPTWRPPERPWRRNIRVRNDGDRAIQVGSHFHFYEVNAGFDEDPDAPAGNVGYRPRGLVVVNEKDEVVSDDQKEWLTRGYRLDIPAGTARRFEPGFSCDVRLVALSGLGTVWGLSTKGKLLEYTWTPASDGDY